METTVLFMSNGDGTFNCSWCEKRTPNEVVQIDSDDEPICPSCYHGSIAEQLSVGDVLKFDGKRNRWLIRAHTKNRRYFLATNKVSNRVYYTIIDFNEEVRGAMNIIGGGLGIFSVGGQDKNIRKAIAMLENSLAEREAYFREHPENVGKVHYDGEWGVSSRNRVPLRITEALIYSSKPTD